VGVLPLAHRPRVTRGGSRRLRSPRRLGECGEAAEPYRRRLSSTNGLERLNREVRRRERVIGIFPNADSALRLLGAMLMEQDEEWTTGRLYFRMDHYWE